VVEWWHLKFYTASEVLGRPTLERRRLKNLDITRISIHLYEPLALLLNASTRWAVNIPDPFRSACLHHSMLFLHVTDDVPCD
jgi:hypothetical protein